MMKTHKFLIGRFTALLLTFCLIATLVPLTAFAAGTPITGVSLTNNSIPENITADMKITADMQSANCGTTGCSVTAAEWNVTRHEDGSTPDNTAITVDTTLGTGDTICQTLTVTAVDGYEFDESLDNNKEAVTFNGRQATNVTLWDMDNDGDKELIVGIEYIVQAGDNQPGGGENQPAQGNRFEIALDDVALDGTLPAELGTVHYGVFTPTDDEGYNDVHNFVSLDTDIDDTNNAVTLTKGNTGGNQPRVKYTYNVTESYLFMIYVQPAEGKTVTIQADNAGQMSTVGSYTEPTTLEVPAGAFYRISFSDAGSQPGGGDGRPFPDESGTDAAASANAIKVRFADRNDNSLYYDKFHADTTAGVMGTVQYSYDGTYWYEFSKERVTTDDNLYWHSQGEAENKVHTYYFGDNSNVQLKLTAGDVSCDALNGKLTNGTVYTLNASTTYTLKHDDGVRNIMWSDDSQDADARVEHGKVIIEKAVIGDENALISGGQFGQQGNKGYVGIKGGATVTVKLIPDYGYQVSALELNGQRLTPDTEEATYTFTMPDTNLHLAVIFEESSDEINATSDGVNGGSITGGENVIDSGNLRLSVINSTMTDTQKAQMQNSTAAKNTDILSYLEVDLEKFVNKGNSGEEWSEDLEELSNKIKITLNVGTTLDANKTYVVVREHNGVYEQIPAVYDKEAGTLTFESDKFSDYALATVSSVNPTHTHSYGNWKHDGTNHWKECSCGDKSDVAVHDFKLVVDKEATASAAGSKHEECKICGYKRPAVTIPATGSTKASKPEESNPNTNADDTKNPQTGDNSNMSLWFALLFISFGGVIGTTVYNRNKKSAR